MITIGTLRGAGLSDKQIVDVLEKVEAEKIARRREQNRINKQNQRSRQQISADSADTPPPLSPPSSSPPIPPLIISPSNTPSPLSRAVAVATRPGLDVRFEEFWKAYPKRDGANPKEPARKKFIAALKSGVDVEAIISGARGYAAAEAGKIGTPYIAQAITWLNQRRWGDYSATAPPSSEPPKPPPGSVSADELRKRYAEGRTDEAATAARAEVLARGMGPHSEAHERGMGVDSARHRGIHRLGNVFSIEGLEAVRDQTDRTKKDNRDDDASPMARVV